MSIVANSDIKEASKQFSALLEELEAYRKQDLAIERLIAKIRNIPDIAGCEAHDSCERYIDKILEEFKKGHILCAKDINPIDTKTGKKLELSVPDAQECIRYFLDMWNDYGEGKTDYLKVTLTGRDVIALTMAHAVLEYFK